MLGERVGHRLAGLRIAHAEAGIAVLAVAALAHDGPTDDEVRIELGAPRPLTQWTGQMPAVLLEVRRGFRVPVLGVEDARPGRPGRSISRLTTGTTSLAALDVQAAGGIGEIVLDVDDDQRCSGIVAWASAAEF